LVFVAELGDKTQLVVLTMGARQRLVAALVGLGATIAVLQLLAVTVGAAIGEAVPDDVLGVASGLLFCAFAVWAYLEARSAGDDEDEVIRPPTSLPTLMGAFFLAELGDKTMLSAATLATNHGVVATWIGSTIGLFAATVLALLVGQSLGRRVSVRTLGLLGAAAFAIAGVATIVFTLL
jgi:putative Ca2+/H+ antiporter (TMEM165/GDT1 family)